MSSKDRETSWGMVADWYDTAVETRESYQNTVILPNLVRQIGQIGGEKLLDVACGQGFFAEEFGKVGAKVTACDVSPELLAIAKKRSGGGVDYQEAPANKLAFAKDGEYDLATFVMAIQNIQDVPGAVGEISRVLRRGGRLFVVMNHPAFRIPKKSSWVFDQENHIQYRRLDAYMSESSEKIDMTPGGAKKVFTKSFHRPLQYYFKVFAKNGLAVTRLEEWISNKKSEIGPRQEAEDISRKEFPLFLSLTLEKTDERFS